MLKLTLIGQIWINVGVMYRCLRKRCIRYSLFFHIINNSIFNKKANNPIINIFIIHNQYL
jgi:hypothetical protein